MNKASWRPLVRGWPFIALGALALLFALMLTFSRKAPAIASLEPPMAAPGAEVVVSGDYFGRTAREGTLSLAGEIPPPSLIKSWSDQKIVFIVPEDATSGLVSVSNSQGTSTGVLFTNTESIPTVLQAASAPGAPLLAALAPPQPAAGQVVTLTGRGFGSGDHGPSVRILPEKGPTIELEATDCLDWSDRSVSFRWPSGARSASVQVVTPLGSTVVMPVAASSPFSFENPLPISLEITVKVAPVSGPVVVWAPLPLNPGSWTLASLEPAPVSKRPLTFRWGAGFVGDRRASYKLNLTNWARHWDGIPAGSFSGDAERGDDRPLDWWKPSQAALKTLTAKWGLDVNDPWLRVQRIQTGITAAFQLVAGGGPPRLSRPTAQILASSHLDSLEASSLAAAIAGPSLPVRLITGLWLDDDGNLVSRVWNEVWITGAGWVSWDVVDGNPGSLDNRHIAFGAEFSPPVRLEPHAVVIGPVASFGQGEPAGEAVWTEQEPVVQWEVKRSGK